MSFAPSLSRAHILFLILVITSQEGYALLSFSGINDIFNDINRIQAWEPRELILSVQEQEVNNSIAGVAEDFVEEDDFSGVLENLFDDNPQPQLTLGLPSELWVMIAHHMPYAALFNAVQARLLRIGEATYALAESARSADEANRGDLFSIYLQEALGLLYRRPELNYIEVLDAEVLARFAGDIYGVHLVGDNAIPEPIGRDLYYIWTLFLLDAAKSGSNEVRSRAYCELGFVLRLNVLAEQDVRGERVYQCLSEGLGSLGYPEYFSLFVAFEHCLAVDVYSQEMRKFTFGCMIAMALQPKGQPLVGEIKRVLVDQYNQGLLSPDNEVIVDRLFIHPEKFFRFRLM